VSTITLSRAEYLVILDILHADKIYGLEGHTLFPADRETHLELIHQGIRQLESRGLVEINRGRHIIERRLLEIVSIVAHPQVVITTLRDQAGIGTQLYLHYQAGDGVVEQVLPTENQVMLGQLPDIPSALDHMVRLLDLPTGSADFRDGHAIDRNRLYEAQARVEGGDHVGAITRLASIGWPAAFAEGYLAAVAGRTLTSQVNIMAIVDGKPGESSSLTLVRDEDDAWLLIPQPKDKDTLHVRQVNAASFRTNLEETYSDVYEQAGEQP